MNLLNHSIWLSYFTANARQCIWKGGERWNLIPKIFNVLLKDVSHRAVMSQNTIIPFYRSFFSLFRYFLIKTKQNFEINFCVEITSEILHHVSMPVEGELEVISKTFLMVLVFILQVTSFCCVFFFVP